MSFNFHLFRIQPNSTETQTNCEIKPLFTLIQNFTLFFSFFICRAGTGKYLLSLIRRCLKLWRAFQIFVGASGALHYFLAFFKSNTAQSYWANQSSSQQSFWASDIPGSGLAQLEPDLWAPAFEPEPEPGPALLLFPPSLNFWGAKKISVSKSVFSFVCYFCVRRFFQ